MPKKQEPVILTAEDQIMVENKSKMIQISEEDWNKTQETLKMLYEVADKGRIFNYESQRTTKKPLRVKLSKYQNKIIIGWRTVKDELIAHPTTGKIVGEKQEYELLLLDSEGNTSKALVDGYPNFTSARYTERIEADVVGKKEDFDGKTTFEIQLPDGRKISLDARFVN